MSIKKIELTVWTSRSLISGIESLYNLLGYSTGQAENGTFSSGFSTPIIPVTGITVLFVYHNLSFIDTCFQGSFLLDILASRYRI